MDFPAHWTFGCVPVVEILKDTGGHYLFKKQIFPPQSHRGSFNHTAPVGLFFLVSSMGPYAKSRTGTFDIGLE